MFCYAYVISNLSSHLLHTIDLYL